MMSSCGPKAGYCRNASDCDYYQDCEPISHRCLTKAGFCENDDGCDFGACAGHVCSVTNLNAGARTSIVLILDDSGSMQGTKIEKAKEAAKGAVGSVNNSQAEFSLFDFQGCTPRQLSNFTSNRREIKSEISNMSPLGSTPLAASLEKAYQLINGSDAPIDRAFVILFTDGEETCQGNPCGVVEKYRSALPVPVYTIGYFVDAKGQTALQCIANKSGGVYIAAPDTETLQQTFSEITGLMSVTCQSNDDCPGNFVCENTKCAPSKMHLVYVPVGIPADSDFTQEADRQHQFVIHSLPSLSACQDKVKKTVLTRACDINQSESDYQKIIDTQRCVEEQMGGWSYDYFVAIAPKRGFLENDQTIGVTSAALPGMISRMGWEVTTAHEMGHQFGLVDEYCKGGPKCNVLPNPLKAEYGCNPDGPCCYKDGLTLYSQFPFVSWRSCSKPYGYDYCCDGNKNDEGGTSIMSWADAPGPRAHDPPSLEYLENQSKLRCDR